MSTDIIDERLLGALHLRTLDRAGFVHDPAAEHVAFQAGTLDALMAGGYDGDATIGELLAHGDLGVGTVQALGGEMVVLDGEAFLIDGDGAVRPVRAEERTPFAVVCRFVPLVTVRVASPLGLRGLHELVDAHRPALGERPAEVLALRVDGEFADLRLRSVHAQQPPYPPLSDVTAHQSEWTLGQTVGTLVGFRFPDGTAGVEVPGYHLHFLSEDRRHGGHVLDATLIEGTVAIDGADELHVELPDGIELGVPGAADRDQIRAVEGG